MLLRDYDVTRKVAKAAQALPYVRELQREAAAFDRELPPGAGFGEHQVRVGHLALELGHDIGLKPEELYELGRGAFIHDNGKPWINGDREYAKYLSSKPGPLSPQELLDMRTHTRSGFVRANALAGYSLGHVIIINHHDSDAFGTPSRLGERRSMERAGPGRRNPQGLEETIGQLVAAADIVDPLIVRRPYNVGKLIDVPHTFAYQFTGSDEIADAMLRRLVERYPHAARFLRSA